MVVRYRRRQESAAVAGVSEPTTPRLRPTSALTEAEEAAMLDLLGSPEFVDQSPHTVYHTLLDRQVRLCSISSMYRLLRPAGQGNLTGLQGCQDLGFGRWKQPG